MWGQIMIHYIGHDYMAFTDYMDPATPVHKRLLNLITHSLPTPVRQHWAIWVKRLHESTGMAISQHNKTQQYHVPIVYDIL